MGCIPAMKVRVRLRLRLLGRFALTAVNDSSAQMRLSTRKAAALLAYLAMSEEQTAGREELATLLWGSCSEQQARQSLRQALASLRKEIGDAQAICADANTVRLKPGLWSVDAWDFELLTHALNADELRCAGRLFGGAFLHGLNIDEEGFDEWVNRQRLRVQLATARLCETY